VARSPLVQARFRPLRKIQQNIFLKNGIHATLPTCQKYGSGGMAGFFWGDAGLFRGGRIGEKNEKSFRETPKPLKNLKTAKSGNFCSQQYQ
jgi:hypothetical protein